MIKVENVTKSFMKKKAVDNVSLHVARGGITGLIGPSGCGKTTLVNLIMGLLLPDEGRILVDGEPAPFPRLRAQMGLMPQETALYEDITALENLRFFGGLYGMRGRELRKRSDELLGLLGLGGQGGKVVRAFSGGMKRRLSLAVALLHRPQLLVLDEPTVGLDPVQRLAIWDLLGTLAARGATVLITTHVLDEAGRCDELVMMRGGRLVGQAPPASFMDETGARTLEEAFVALVSRAEGQKGGGLR